MYMAIFKIKGGDYKTRKRFSPAVYKGVEFSTTYFILMKYRFNALNFLIKIHTVYKKKKSFYMGAFQNLYGL